MKKIAIKIETSTEKPGWNLMIGGEDWGEKHLSISPEKVIEIIKDKLGYEIEKE